MALQLANLSHGSDVTDDFFRLSLDAEKHRKREYEAVILLQKTWRGYLTRRWIGLINLHARLIQKVFRGWRGRVLFEKLVIRRNYERRMQFYHSNATIIQKVWRGYCSRKHKFDFNKRKAYINEVKRKIVQFREEIAERVKQQRHREKATEMEKFEERIKKLAAVRHHLLSTKAIPGIHNRPRRISHASNVEEEVLHEGERDETAENEGMLIRRNARLGSIMHIPEEKMQTNPVLKDWLQATIGTNHRGINLKPGQVDENEEPRPVEKRAQGPFLPTYALEKKLNRPFRPTLRVQTDFYGVRVHEREERRKEAALRVSDQAFRAGQYIHHPHPDYFLDGEPYRLYSYGSRLFRETEKHRLKGFKSVLPPVEFFDDFSA